MATLWIYFPRKLKFHGTAPCSLTPGITHTGICVLPGVYNTCINQVLFQVRRIKPDHNITCPVVNPLLMIHSILWKRDAELPLSPMKERRGISSGSTL